jgi:hypothetical protein
MNLTIGITLRKIVNKNGKVVKQRLFYCSSCWYTSPRIKMVQHHQKTVHTIGLDKFLGEINDNRV